MLKRESDKTIKKNEEDRKTAADFRKTGMPLESIGETTKRSMEDEDGNVVKRKRRSGSEAVDYLRERADMEMPEIHGEGTGFKERATRSGGHKTLSSV